MEENRYFYNPQTEKERKYANRLEDRLQCRSFTSYGYKLTLIGDDGGIVVGMDWTSSLL
ncbi:hypothetical protein J6590_071892 [Homalodisca vitripennis]|nr:hypothetical protein J6590_071892 [Homalodisca vitripennis]